MRKHRRAFLHVAGVIALAAVLAIPAVAATTTTVVVNDQNVGVDWFPNDTRAGGSTAFADGPGAPPLGAGSLHFATTDTMGGSGQAKAQLFNYDYIGTPLADIDELSYWAWKSSASTNSAAQTLALNIEVDYVGDGSSYTTLVFEPVYQPGGVGAMLTDTWQLWDALSGGSAIWWSTKAIPGVPLAFDSFVPWSTILANNPDAKIKFAVGFNVGSGWVGEYQGAGDGLAIGVSGCTTVHDFERYVSPQETKMAAAEGLAALLPTGDGKDDERIEKAIERIEKSLDPAYWASDSELTSNGKHVFDEEKNALKELARVKNTDVSAYVAAIVGVDRTLAENAIAAAILAGGDEDDVAKAQSFLAKGLGDLADGKYDKAVEDFKRAWDFARKAVS